MMVRRRPYLIDATVAGVRIAGWRIGPVSLGVCAASNEAELTEVASTIALED